LVQNPEASLELRRLSLHILTLALPKSLPEVTAIASLPLEEEDGRKDELSLRIGAVLSIDSLEEDNARTAYYSILDSDADGAVKKLAKVSLSGWADNRPRKLKRFFDRARGTKLGEKL
jgi:hypothetical protein